MNPDYQKKKIHAGRALGFDAKLLLQGLMDRINSDLKQLVIINPSKTTTEWRKRIHWLNKQQIAYIKNKSFKQSMTNNEIFHTLTNGIHKDLILILTWTLDQEIIDI